MSALTRTTSLRFLHGANNLDPVAEETESEDTSSVSSLDSLEYNNPPENLHANVDSPKSDLTLENNQAPKDFLVSENITLTPFDLAEKYKEIGADLEHFKDAFEKEEQQYWVYNKGPLAKPTIRASAYLDCIESVYLRADSEYRNEDGSLISKEKFLSALSLLNQADERDVWPKSLGLQNYREAAIEAINGAKLILGEVDAAECGEQDECFEAFDSADETELRFMSHFDRYGSYLRA